VAFRTAAGKHDLSRAGVYKLRHLLTRLLHRSARLLALLVDRGRVAELLEEIRSHRFKHVGQERAGRVVVEVDPVHDSLYSIVSLDSARLASDSRAQPTRRRQLHSGPLCAAGA